MTTDGSSTHTIASKIFRKQKTICLPTDPQPHRVIIILLDVGNLDITNHIAIIHHSQATGPTVVEHSRLGDAPWSSHEHSKGFSTFIHYFVAGVTEGIAVFGHELELFLEFFGSPEVIAVEEGYPFAFCLREGAVAGDGSPAVLGVFEIRDSFCEILRLRLRSAQDDTLNNGVGVVGAGIVNDNKFPVCVGLGQYGFYRFFDEPGRIITGHYYGDQAVHSTP